MSEHHSAPEPKVTEIEDDTEQLEVVCEAADSVSLPDITVTAVSDETSAGTAAASVGGPPTVGAILGGRDTVCRLSQQPVGLASAQQILKLRLVVDQVFKLFNEGRNEIASRLGTPDGENKWALEPEQADAFRAEEQALLSATVNFPPESQISLDDLKDARVSAEDLLRLEFALRH